MAKGNRFPSDANKKPVPAMSAAAKQDVAAKEAKGEKQVLVQVQYKKDNHHVIHGVHALRNGVNHLPKSIWDEAKKSPSMQQLIKDGHVMAPEELDQESAAE